MRPRTGYYITNTLAEHVSLLKQQVTRSLRDPGTVQLATRLVSGKFDYVQDGGSGRRLPVVAAWGSYYHAPTSRPCGTQNARCEIQTIWDFWVANVRYTLDPEGVDTFRTVRYTLEAGGGDCDDSAIGLGALLKALGFKMAARVISTDGNYWEHVYAMVGCPKGGSKSWVPLDPTVSGKKPGWQYDKVRTYRDFLL